MPKKDSIVLVVLIIALAAASRLTKHPANFTPILAMSVFAGFYLKKWWGVAIPLVAMLASDYFLGFYDLSLLLSVYVGVAAAYFLSWAIIKKLKWFAVLGTSILSSVVFFVITNYAVWQFADWYPHTWAGLVSCFAMALPFFRNSIVGDLVYVAVFFLAYKLANDYVVSKFFVKKATA